MFGNAGLLGFLPYYIRPLSGIYSVNSCFMNKSILFQIAEYIPYNLRNRFVSKMIHSCAVFRGFRFVCGFPAKTLAPGQLKPPVSQSKSKKCSVIREASLRKDVETAPEVSLAHLLDHDEVEEGLCKFPSLLNSSFLGDGDVERV